MPGCNYCKYFIVGTIVGISALVAREIAGLLLPSDTPAYYMLSVTLVYAVGIVASFYAHYRITFSHIPYKRAAIQSIGSFSLIAMIGMFITSILSVQIRYYMGLQEVFGKLLPSFAFGSATVIASLVTYALNKRYTFVTSMSPPEMNRMKIPKEQQCQQAD